MKGRLVVFLVVMALWAAGISARLYQLQVVEHESYARRAFDQQLQMVDLAPPRGTIFDARGRKLAVSMAVDSAYVLPHKLADVEDAAERIAPILGSTPAGVLERLIDERPWLWLTRQLDPPVAEALRKLDIEGIGFVEESKRFYPLDELAGPVLGFVGTDHSGLAGLELAYDSVVSGEPMRRRFLKDALNDRVVAPGFSFIDAAPGADLHLTIDATVQYIVEDELARALEKSHARAGVAVLMQPHTGAILAMASLPAFNPNRFGDYERAQWRNAAVEDAFEPGSTFKAITAAAALERNLIDPMDVIDCEQGEITIGSTRIRDHKPFGELTFREVIARSSNVGAIKAGLRLERSEFFDDTRRFGFGSATDIDLPGENSGIVRGVEKWSKYEAAYLSIGQGISATPVQLIRAFGAMANGGYLVEPHVVATVDRGGRREAPARAESDGPVVSAATLRSLTRLLEAVVEEGGGAQAAVPGYRVAGKTGTAQKALPGVGYLPDRYVASFLGFVPSRRPEVVAMVMLDEPRGLFYGGEVAAPVFAAIMTRVLPYLGVAPGAPEDFEPTLETGAPVPATGTLLARTVRPPTGATTASDEIPDVRGLTAREAIQTLAQSGLRPRLHGSGFVELQSPQAGRPLTEAGGEIEIWLGASS
ncbi:MAG: PASTA domain-containing protein [bacterium]|nr:PASTA domain-containing protein [bacterium]